MFSILQERRGQAFADGPGFAPEHLRAAKVHLSNLVKIVRPHEERSGLTPRERTAATEALESLAALAGNSIGAPTVAAFMYVEVPAWLALLQVNSIAVRVVAEAGGAARAAAISRHPERNASSASGSEVPRASSAEAWAKAVHYSSGLLGTLLAKQLDNELPDPNPRPSGSLQHLTASMEAHIRRRGYGLASALLRSDALSVLSRLLAAEAHRGNGAVLDTDTVITTLWPLMRLLRLANVRPEETLWLGQEVGKAQLGPAVLRALAASGVVEHVCRFAVTRLAGQQAGGGTAGLGARKLNQHLAFVMTQLQWMTSYAAEALKETGEAAAHARAVLSSPCYQVSAMEQGTYLPACNQRPSAVLRDASIKLCENVPFICLFPAFFSVHMTRYTVSLQCPFLFLTCHQTCSPQLLPDLPACSLRQTLLTRGKIPFLLPSPQYLVHLQVVSQLHALDGGTTYGLPHDKLLPPVRAEGAEAGSGGPTVLNNIGLQTALTLWRTKESGEGTYLHTLEGRRVVLDLLLRMARAILDSADYFAAAGSSSSGAGGRGSGRGASAAGSSQGQPSAAPGPGPVPAAVVKVDEYPSHTLAALVCTLVICKGCAERHGSAGGSSGSHGAGGSSAAASGSGAGAGSSSGSGCGACLGGGQGDQDGDSTGPAWLWWRRRDHGRWWRLAVRAVHAEMDRGDDRFNPTFTVQQTFLAMNALWGTAETLDTGAPREWAASHEGSAKVCGVHCLFGARWHVRL